MEISKNFENFGHMKVVVEKDKVLIGLGADTGAYNVATLSTMDELDDAILALNTAKNIVNERINRQVCFVIKGEKNEKH